MHPGGMISDSKHVKQIQHFSPMYAITNRILQEWNACNQGYAMARYQKRNTQGKNITRKTKHYFDKHITLINPFQHIAQHSYRPMLYSFIGFGVVCISMVLDGRRFGRLAFYFLDLYIF